MADLLACPFCRELFTAGEAEVCPVCDVVLRPLADLPPSLEVREQMAVAWERTHPLDRRLPLAFWRRGRGLLLGLTALGMGLFFSPWIELVAPHSELLSGFDLVRARGFWFGGGAVAWLVAAALVASRRTIRQMHGVRAVLAMLVSVTFFQTVLLWLMAPTARVIRFEYHWAWGLWVSAGVSVLAVFVAMRFGGRLDDLPREALEAVAEREPAPAKPVRSSLVPARSDVDETSSGHTLH